MRGGRITADETGDNVLGALVAQLTFFTPAGASRIARRAALRSARAKGSCCCAALQLADGSTDACGCLVTKEMPYRTGTHPAHVDWMRQRSVLGYFPLRIPRAEARGLTALGWDPRELPQAALHGIEYSAFLGSANPSTRSHLPAAVAWRGPLVHLPATQRSPSERYRSPINPKASPTATRMIALPKRTCLARPPNTSMRTQTGPARISSTQGKPGS